MRCHGSQITSLSRSMGGTSPWQLFHIWNERRNFCPIRDACSSRFVVSAIRSTITRLDVNASPQHRVRLLRLPTDFGHPQDGNGRFYIQPKKRIKKRTENRWKNREGWWGNERLASRPGQLTSELCWSHCCRFLLEGAMTGEKGRENDRRQPVRLTVRLTCLTRRRKPADFASWNWQWQQRHHVFMLRTITR